MIEKQRKKDDNNKGKKNSINEEKKCPKSIAGVSGPRLTAHAPALSVMPAVFGGCYRCMCGNTLTIPYGPSLSLSCPTSTFSPLPRPTHVGRGNPLRACHVCICVRVCAYERGMCVSVCMRVCTCEFVLVCVRAYVRVCVRACMRGCLPSRLPCSHHPCLYTPTPYPPYPTKGPPETHSTCTTLPSLYPLSDPPTCPHSSSHDLISHLPHICSIPFHTNRILSEPYLIDRRYRPSSPVGESLSTVDIDRD